MPPMTWLATYSPEVDQGSSPRRAKARDTAGLKCAPDTGPNVRIRTVRIAPVGSVLHRSASATGTEPEIERWIDSKLEIVSQVRRARHTPAAKHAAQKGDE